MIAALVLLAVLLLLGTIARHVHLAAENGLERFQTLLLALLVDALTVVEKLLDAKHVAVVGDGHALHAVADGLVHQLRDFRLSVEYRIVGMYV